MYIKKFLKHYYVMLVPAFLWLIFFSIVPMFGIIMAFEDYNPGLGMLKSPFIGLENFRYMLQISDVRQAIVNTVIIAVAKIIGNIIVPLTFAILLNELCLKKDKAPDPDHRVYAPFPVLGYSGKDRVKYFWLYRTDQSDPWIFWPVTGSVFRRAVPVSTAGHRHRYLEELRL